MIAQGCLHSTIQTAVPCTAISLRVIDVDQVGLYGLYDQGKAMHVCRLLFHSLGKNGHQTSLTGQGS